MDIQTNAIVSFECGNCEGEIFIDIPFEEKGYLSLENAPAVFQEYVSINNNGVCPHCDSKYGMYFDNSEIVVIFDEEVIDFIPLYKKYGKPKNVVYK